MQHSGIGTRVTAEPCSAVPFFVEPFFRERYPLSSNSSAKFYGSECFHLMLLLSDAHAVRCAIRSRDASGFSAALVGPLIYSLYMHLDKIPVETPFIGRRRCYRRVLSRTTKRDPIGLSLESLTDDVAKDRADAHKLSLNMFRAKTIGRKGPQNSVDDVCWFLSRPPTLSATGRSGRFAVLEGVLYYCRHTSSVWGRLGRKPARISMMCLNCSN
jgi:hypothetical protein